MSKLRLFFVIFGFFFSLQLLGQNEEELRQELQSTKNKTLQLQIRLRLIDAIYERNRFEWHKEIEALVLQRNAYAGKHNQALIALLAAENQIFVGNIQGAKRIFEEELASFNFKNSKAVWKKKLLGCSLFPETVQYHYATLRKEFANKLKHRDQTAFYLQIAKNFTASFQKDSAIWASNAALQHAKRSDKKWVLIEAMQQQAETYWNFNLFEQAVQRSITSLQLAEEAQLDFFKQSPLLLIANISIEVKNFNQASIYIKLAKDLAKTNTDERALAFSNFLLARYYLGISAYNSASIYAGLAYKWFKEAGNIRYEKKARLLMISANQLTGQNAELAYASLFADLNKKTDPYFAAELYYEYGQYLMRSQKFKLAKTALESSLNSLPNEALVRPKIANAYSELANIAQKTGQFTAAYQYQQKYSNWLENSPVWRSAARIEEMAAANLREERERLIVNQQASIERAQKEREIIELQKDRQLFISIIFIVAIIFGVVIFVLRMQQVKIKQEQREAELSQTLLRTQMNPHFVFNAMSVIQSYIYENDPEKSSQFLVNFSRLMRLILENSPKEFIAIELEREILDKYLAAQKMRFENRFDYELNISDDLIFNKAMVSPMITQPFIENAIEHGQLHTVKGGKIVVNMYDHEKQLVIEIQDNGVGRKKSARTKKLKTHKSMAIDITRERIAILNKKYKFNGSLTIDDLNSQTQTGTSVAMVLPLKYESEQ